MVPRWADGVQPGKLSLGDFLQRSFISFLLLRARKLF